MFKKYGLSLNRHGKRFAVGKSVALAALCFWGCIGIANADPILPGLPAANSYSTITNRGFTINQAPTFLFGGEIEPLRIPRDQWRDRLLRLKRAGYNTVSTYVFWGVYEPKPGEYHFEDNLDLEAWLKLLKDLGMTCFIRLGPYCCGEWDLGGWPVILAGKNVNVRSTDSTFMSYLNPWFTKIIPILAKYQITKGGPIIFYQLENEYYFSNQDPNYKKWLSDKAIALGMELPYLFSGQNHSFEPQPGIFADTLWLTTEFWTKDADWTTWYGEPKSESVSRIQRNTWKICASGAAGFYHYMAFGGTNFGYAGDDGQMTSYDYEAQVAETGRFRADYFGIKRAGLLVQSFNQLLAGSTNGAGLIDDPSAGLVAYINTNKLGKMVFIQNTTASAVPVKIKFKNKAVSVPASGSVSLGAGQYCHFLADYGLTDADTIDYCTPNILGLKTIGQTTYLIVYGSPNGVGEISVRSPSAPAAPWQWNAAAKQATLSYTYPSSDSILEYQMPLKGGKTLKLLVMQDTHADITWITDTTILSGAQYVSDSTVEFPVSGATVVMYSSKGRQLIKQQAITAPAAISISGPTCLNGDANADTALADSSWQHSVDPATMDFYGYQNGYGWYRCAYTAAEASTQTLTMPQVLDYYTIFWNGKLTASTSVQVNKGVNTLAIFVGHYSRDKAVGYIGHLGYADTYVRVKGIMGAVKLGSTALTNWKFKGGLDLDESTIVGTLTNWPQFIAKPWAAVPVGADSTPRFYKYVFNYDVNPAIHQTFRLTCSAISRGAAWINGHSLGRTRIEMGTSSKGFAPLYVPECWLFASDTLVIFSQNGKAPVGLALTPQETYSVHSMTETAIAPQAFDRTSGSGALNLKNEKYGIVFDMQGRVVARESETMPLSTILKTKCSRGVYIFRINNRTKYVSRFSH